MTEPINGLKLTRRALFQIQNSEHPRSLRQIHKFNASVPLSSFALALVDLNEIGKVTLVVANQGKAKQFRIKNCFSISKDIFIFRYSKDIKHYSLNFKFMFVVFYKTT